MLSIIMTLILFVLIVMAIVKKVNVAAALFIVSIVGYLGLFLVHGAGIAGEESTGWAFLDIFEIMFNNIRGTMGSTCLTIIILLGYIEYMNALEASEKFALLLAEPVRKMRSPYLIGAACIFIGVIMNIVLQSSFIIISLMLATIYPAMKAAGCSKESCAAAMIMPTLVTISPSRAAYYMAVSALNMENVSVPMWFFQIQLPVGMAETVVLMFTFIIINRYFDKKENQFAEVTDKEAKSYRDVEVPGYYALLPVLPLIFVVIFSPMINSKITVSAIGVTLLSMVISFFVHAITEKSVLEALKKFDYFYKGMGIIMKGMVPILMFGTTFAEMISSIGGMAAIIHFFGTFANGYFLLGLVGIFGFVIQALTGSYMGNVALMFPFIHQICVTAGIDMVGACTADLLIMAAGEGVSFVAAANLMVCAATDTNILSVMKRTALPSVCAAVTVFAVCSLYF